MIAPTMAANLEGLRLSGGPAGLNSLGVLAGETSRLPQKWGMAARLGASLASGANFLLLAF